MGQSSARGSPLARCAQAMTPACMNDRGIATSCCSAGHTLAAHLA